MTCAKEQSHSRCIHNSVGLEFEAMLCLEASSMVVKSSFHFFIFMNKSSFHIKTKTWGLSSIDKQRKFQNNLQDLKPKAVEAKNFHGLEGD